MSKKRFTLTAIVVLLILSFTVTTVGAQAPVQPGTVDEDGDLVLESVPPLGVDAITNAGKPAAPGTEITSFPPPYPYYPVNNEDLFTKYPDFIFTQLPGASKYKVEVWNAFTNVLVYTLTGSGNCTGGYCTLKPTLPLKNYVITGGKGYYYWKVAPKAGGWQPFSGIAYFYVNSSGFNSSFTTSAKWANVYGSWSIVSPGYLKTEGELYEVSSVIQREWFAVNYVYEVKMKRKVDNGGENRLYFQGYPTPLGDMNDWDRGYAFQYTNYGDWMLYKCNSGSPSIIKDWTVSPYINRYGWNKLTVWRDYPFIDLWINGQYLGWYTDLTFNYGGYVGIAMYKKIIEKSPLLVDSAKLKYTLTQPYPMATLANGEHDPAFELKPPADPSGVNIDTSTP